MASEKRKKLLAMLADLDEQVDDLPDPDGEEGEEEEPEEEAPPKKRAANVANKAGEAVRRQQKAEIEGASEATMQAALNELRDVKALLSGKNPDKAKARTMLDGVFSLLGIGDD